MTTGPEPSETNVFGPALPPIIVIGSVTPGWTVTSSSVELSP